MPLLLDRISPETATEVLDRMYGNDQEIVDKAFASISQAITLVLFHKQSFILGAVFIIACLQHEEEKEFDRILAS